MSAETLVMERQMAIASAQPLSEQKELNQWMYERILPFAKGNILEIESGSGSISTIFVRNGIPLTLSDSGAYYCTHLRKKFEHEYLIKAVQQLDLKNSDFEQVHNFLFDRFNMIFALNVIEHSAIDKMAVINAKKLLAKGGYFILSHPAYTALYNKLDLGLNRWHKYNKQSIMELLSNDFEIIKMRYFNLIGLVVRFLSGPLPGFNMLASEQKKMYNKLVPSFHIEDLAFKQTGLSVIVVARKKN